MLVQRRDDDAHEPGECGRGGAHRRRPLTWEPANVARSPRRRRPSHMPPNLPAASPDWRGETSGVVGLDGLADGHAGRSTARIRAARWRSRSRRGAARSAGRSCCGAPRPTPARRGPHAVPRCRAWSPESGWKAAAVEGGDGGWREAGGFLGSSVLAGWPALLLCRSGGRVGVGHHGDNPLRRRVGIARSMSARKEPKDCWKRRRPREWRLSSRGSSSGNTVESHMDRLKQWVTMGIALLVLGIILHFSHAIPLNKQLYTFSYICVTAGAAGVVFSVFYFLVDILNLRYLFAPLQWIGMNAMLVYVMAAEGIFEGFLNGWYYEGTNNTLVYWVRRHVFVRVWRSARVGILLYVIFAQILFWALVAGLLHRAGLYWKL